MPTNAQKLLFLLQEEVRISQLQSEAPGGPGGPTEADEVQPEPLDMRFPRGGIQKQCMYLILFPIIFPLWLTLPDTRSPKGE